MLAVIGLVAATSASAQVLGQIGPNLGLPLPPVAQQVLNDTDRLVNTSLAELRSLRLQELIRTNPRVIDTDDRGAPVVRGEVLAISPTPESLAIARQAGFEMLRETRLDELGVQLVVLATPDGQSAKRAIRRLRRLDPNGQYDFNHIYTGSAAGRAAPTAVQPQSGPPVRPAASSAIRIGLIDSGVAHHPALAANKIEQKGFAAANPVPQYHGTAIASLLAGSGTAFHGVTPGATLYVADVYGGLPTGGSADIIARAMAWMAKERVPVINISLVGPPNALLEAGVRSLVTRGHVLVAAVGNDGPSAKPLYPAAYTGVIGVTAVDPRNRVLLEAVRGPQVDFAAPGSDMAAASDTGGFVTVRGTSFAAPVVAAYLAQRLSAPDPAAAQQAVVALKTEAVDLGSKGFDRTYGHGLIGGGYRIAPRTVQASPLPISR